jgi:hypothetical protein
MKQICRFYKYSYLSDNRLEKLRNLTANSDSGMNHVLTELRHRRKHQIDINAFIIILYEKKEAIGWALISKEHTSFFKSSFSKNNYKWHPIMGYWMQIFVDRNHRHKGVATKIVEKCNKHIQSKILFADIASPSIFEKLNNSESIW